MIELFEATLDLSLPERAGFLKEACRNEEERRDVEELLAASSQTDVFLSLSREDGSGILRSAIDDFLRIPDDSTVDVFTELSRATPTPRVPSSIGDYEILEEIGRGGMGVVYRARQRRLQRVVALKVLAGGALTADHLVDRFRREARATARIRHSNIVPIHDVGEANGAHYYAMDFIDGRSLATLIERARREDTRSEARYLSDVESVSALVERMAELAEGLAEVHAQGLVHRDIKPSNIIVDGRGCFVLVDFGLVQDEASSRLTRSGTLLGTLPYMSPEQVARHRVDARSDVYSFGVTLFEALTLRPPFEEKSERELAESILFKESPSPRRFNPRVNRDLNTIILHALEKSPDRRYQSASDLAADLRRLMRYEPIEARLPSRWTKVVRKVRRHKTQVTLAAAFLLTAVVALLLGWKWSEDRREHERRERLRAEVMPRIRDLVGERRFLHAYVCALGLERQLPHEPALEELWPQITLELSIVTVPPGANVSITEVSDPDGEWLTLGSTPLKRARIPRGVYRWRFEKEGYDTVVRGQGGSTSLVSQLKKDRADGSVVCVRLREIGEVRPGMVPIPATTMTVGGVSVSVPEYWIDRCEVTNRAFQAFVDEGGYSRTELWKETFHENGETLSWEEAMRAFVDRTGKPGPATWSNGNFPAGKADHPVTGVSWYEAAAYAAFHGKELPTLHHWTYASCPYETAAIVPYSNFSIGGTSPVTTHTGMGITGLYDMAGNVREWTSTATDKRGERRYLVGGAWGEPTYSFHEQPPVSVWDRSPKNGVRCVVFPDRRAGLDARIFAPSTRPPFERDFRKLEPVSDEEFRFYETVLYSYDRHVSLEARVEAVDDTPLNWREEKISFTAAYDEERLPAVLRLPKRGTPPYPAVIYFPGNGAQTAPHPAGRGDTNVTAFLLENGYAVMYPTYEGTYERRFNGPRPLRASTVYRDWQVKLRKDVSRSIDYLRSRGDIDRELIGYYGISWGAMSGPVFLALDDRLRAAILVLGGLPRWEALPAADEFNFVPRVTLPVLMLGAELDHLFPLEEAQQPMFDLLGTPPGHKELVVYRGAGHGMLGLYIADVERDVLRWLDRYLSSEWRQLFNNKDLSDWHSDGDSNSFKVQDEILRIHPVGETEACLFYTGDVEGGLSRFENFELEATVRAEPDSEGSIFVQSVPVKRSTGEYRSRQYEVRLSSSPIDARKTGSLHGVVDVEKSHVDETRWFVVRIVVADEWIRVFVGGQEVVDYSGSAEAAHSSRNFSQQLAEDRGTVGLCVEGTDSVWFFKNIRLRRISSVGSSESPVSARDGRASPVGGVNQTR